MTRVALFVPNIIGYLRAITGIAGFYFCDTNPWYSLPLHFYLYSLFMTLYAISYVLDAFDGVAARRLNQCIIYVYSY